MLSDDDETRMEAKDASKLRALLAAAVDAILTINRMGIIEAANPAVERLFQYRLDEMLGVNIKLLMPEPYHSEHDGYLKRYGDTGEPRIIGSGREVVGRRKDGTTFPMHLSVSEFEAEGEVFFTGIIHDLSERKRAEDALHQAQKMDAVGQLTGGLAHDFNNLLTVIIGNLELLESQVDDEALLALLSEAQEAADLGARLTEGLLAFARRSPLEPAVVDLNALVDGLSDMLHRTLGETIGVSTVLATDLWAVKADPAQIESALVNLAVNARDAMSGSGKLIVETGNMVIDAYTAAAVEGLKEGEYARLSVTDTGAGMAPAVRERVFEPFFTTKEAGRGTGLGLSMVYGFAKQSKGHVSIDSEVGRGTTVNLYLPRHAVAIDDASADAASTTGQGSGEVILVVEDDARVRRLTRARLQSLGYRIHEAPDGHEALEILAAGTAVDLMFTDLVMPGGMSGTELCDQVRRRWPAVKLLTTSGYADNFATDGEGSADRVALLRKPYRLAELSRVIRDALAGTGS